MTQRAIYDLNNGTSSIALSFDMFRAFHSSRFASAYCYVPGALPFLAQLCRSE